MKKAKFRHLAAIARTRRTGEKQPRKGWLTRTGWDGQLIRCGENVEICPQEVYFVDPYYLGWT